MSECNSIENTDLRTKNKERIRIKARDKYRNLSEEKKKKREYGKNRYHNMYIEKKQRLKNTKKIIKKTIVR